MFEGIYVSSAKDNVKIFEAVVQSPTLSKCVRHLRYDATRFVDGLSKDEHIRELWNQKPWITEAEKSSTWISPDTEVNDWVDKVILGNMPAHKATQRFRHTILVQDGYRCYSEHAEYQRAISTSGQYLEILIKGLPKLKALRSVTLEGSWQNMCGFGERPKGSFLERHWPRFYCKPQKWECRAYSERNF